MGLTSEQRLAASYAILQTNPVGLDMVDYEKTAGFWPKPDTVFESIAAVFRGKTRHILCTV